MWSEVCHWKENKIDDVKEIKDTTIINDQTDVKTDHDNKQ